MDNKKRIKQLRLLNNIRLAYSCVMGAVILVGIIIGTMFCIGVRPFIVVSGSMEPAVHVGSVCAVNMNFPYKNIADNDIISFRNGDMTVTHRAIEVRKNGIVTKGDANNTKDANLVTADNYMGKVVFSVPYLGYAAAVLKTKFGIFMGISFVVLSLLIDALLDIMKDIAASPEDSIGDTPDDEGDINEEQEQKTE